MLGLCYHAADTAVAADSVVAAAVGSTEALADDVADVAACL